jgi:hypothetical protein
MRTVLVLANGISEACTNPKAALPGSQLGCWRSSSCGGVVDGVLLLLGCRQRYGAQNCQRQSLTLLNRETKTARRTTSRWARNTERPHGQCVVQNKTGEQTNILFSCKRPYVFRRWLVLVLEPAFDGSLASATMPRGGVLASVSLLSSDVIWRSRFTKHEPGHGRW